MGFCPRTALLAALLLTGCNACEGPAGPPAAPAPSASSVAPNPTSMDAHRFTDGTIALNNLDSQTRTAAKLVEAGRLKDFGGKLVELLLTRAQFRGRIADDRGALEVAEKLVEVSPNDPKAYALRARARSTLHLFQDALSDLDTSEKLGQPPEKNLPTRASIAAGQGDLERALTLYRTVNQESPAAGSLGAEASVLAKLGRFEEASARFREAHAAYGDSSPLTPAWLHFEEGTVCERRGDRACATGHFRAALGLLPTYAHAASHLATLVPAEEAVAFLTPLLATSDDPEVAQMLGERLLDQGKTDEANQHLTAAQKAYDALVDVHPAAFSDHAGWFYLDVKKDAPKALSLAKKNLAVRRDARAYELALLAAIESKSTEDLCAIRKDAMAYPYLSSIAKSAVERAASSCP